MAVLNQILREGLSDHHGSHLQLLLFPETHGTSKATLSPSHSEGQGSGTLSPPGGSPAQTENSEIHTRHGWGHLGSKTTTQKPTSISTTPRLYLAGCPRGTGQLPE